MARISRLAFLNYKKQVKELYTAHYAGLGARQVSLRNAAGKTVCGPLQATLYKLARDQVFAKHHAVDRRLDLSSRWAQVQSVIEHYKATIAEFSESVELNMHIPAVNGSYGYYLDKLREGDKELCETIDHKIHEEAVKIAQQSSDPFVQAWAELAIRDLDELAEDIAHAVHFTKEAKLYLATLHQTLAKAGMASPFSALVVDALLKSA